MYQSNIIYCSVGEEKAYPVSVVQEIMVARREVLAGGLLFLAGCSTDGAEHASPTTEPHSGGYSFDPDIAATCHREHPDIPPNGADFTCFNSRDDSDAPVAMTSTETTYQLPAEMGFTLDVRRDQAYEGGFYRWELYKREHDAWHYIAPTEWADLPHRVESGGTHTWRLRADADAHNDGEAFAGEAVESMDVELLPLGPGEYTFGITGTFQGAENVVGAAVSFEVAGDELALTVSDGTSNISTAEETVEADWQPWFYDDHELDGTFILERESAESAERLVPEQVLRNWTLPLRDALALARTQSAETVRLHVPDTKHLPEGNLSFQYTFVDGTAATFRTSLN